MEGSCKLRRIPMSDLHFVLTLNVGPSATVDSPDPLAGLI
jgi:hypothetical protein